MISSSINCGLLYWIPHGVTLHSLSETKFMLSTKQFHLFSEQKSSKSNLEEAEENVERRSEKERKFWWVSLIQSRKTWLC